MSQPHVRVLLDQDERATVKIDDAWAGEYDGASMEDVLLRLASLAAKSGDLHLTTVLADGAVLEDIIRTDGSIVSAAPSPGRREAVTEGSSEVWDVPNAPLVQEPEPMTRRERRAAEEAAAALTLEPMPEEISEEDLVDELPPVDLPVLAGDFPDLPFLESILPEEPLPEVPLEFVPNGHQEMMQPGPFIPFDPHPTVPENGIFDEAPSFSEPFPWASDEESTPLDFEPESPLSAESPESASGLFDSAVEDTERPRRPPSRFADAFPPPVSAGDVADDPQLPAPPGKDPSSWRRPLEDDEEEIDLEVEMAKLAQSKHRAKLSLIIKTGVAVLVLAAGILYLFSFSDKASADPVTTPAAVVQVASEEPPEPEGGDLSGQDVSVNPWLMGFGFGGIGLAVGGAAGVILVKKRITEA